jgi:hypothetical protein
MTKKIHIKKKKVQITKKPKTTDKPPKRPGKGGIIPPDPKKPFSKKYQPSPEAKKAGWAKKKRAQELVKAVLDLQFKGKAGSRVRKEAADYFGIAASEITVETMLVFRQAQRAIEKSDTPAFNAVMDRAFGKPKEKVEVNQKINLDKLPVTFE